MHQTNELFPIKYFFYFSGGNKRKVNAAIAFLGKPSVVILDGMKENFK